MRRNHVDRRRSSRYERNSKGMIQMDSSIFGVIALAVGMGICAAGGLFAARTASRREGIDRAADEMPNTAERYR